MGYVGWIINHLRT